MFTKIFGNTLGHLASASPKVGPVEYDKLKFRGAIEIHLLWTRV